MFLFQYLGRYVEAEAKWLSFALKKVREAHISEKIDKAVYKDMLNIP